MAESVSRTAAARRKRSGRRLLDQHAVGMVADVMGAVGEVVNEPERQDEQGYDGEAAGDGHPGGGGSNERERQEQEHEQGDAPVDELLPGVAASSSMRQLHPAVLAVDLHPDFVGDSSASRPRPRLRRGCRTHAR